MRIAAHALLGSSVADHNKGQLKDEHCASADGFVVDFEDMASSSESLIFKT